MFAIGVLFRVSYSWFLRHGAGTGRLFGTSFERSRMCLGRLLHYYALGPEDDADIT